MTGMILPGDPHDFIEFINTIEKAQRMDRLVIDSPGGFVEQAGWIAGTIRNTGLTVAVPARALCASACVTIFAAAVRREAGEGARIGVHHARMALAANEEKSALNTTENMVMQYLVFGMPERVTRKLRDTPANKITWLDKDDLAAMNVHPYLPWNPKPAEHATPAAALPAAKSSPAAFSHPPAHRPERDS